MNVLHDIDPDFFGEQPASADNHPSGWQARLALHFTGTAKRTVLTGRRHCGPLQVQRPFYPESDGACHLYILHPPGGVVGGDGLTLEAELTANTRVLLTTPAAAKIYRSDGALARQTQILRVGADATLEWLPQETIVFEGARLRSLTRVELSGNAHFIGWEILCLGRPAAGETFGRGLCRTGFEIRRDGLPLYLEQGRYEGGSDLLEAAWGLQGFPVTASLVCASDASGLAERVRETVEPDPADRFTVSQLQGVLVCRYLGDSTERAGRLFRQVWSVLRPMVLNKPAVAPRIWST